MLEYTQSFETSVDLCKLNRKYGIRAGSESVFGIEQIPKIININCLKYELKYVVFSEDSLILYLCVEIGTREISNT